jgi:hypothetical protein
MAKQGFDEYGITSFEYQPSNELMIIEAEYLPVKHTNKALYIGTVLAITGAMLFFRRKGK